MRIILATLLFFSLADVIKADDCCLPCHYTDAVDVRSNHDNRLAMAACCEDPGCREVNLSTSRGFSAVPRYDRCPSGWDKVCGACFRAINLNTLNTTWPQAAALCDSSGARLAKLNSAQYAYTVQQRASLSCTYMFIGATKANSTDWQWLDGSPAELDWHFSQPQGVFGEDYTLVHGVTNQVHDTFANVAADCYMCEKEYQ